jgi:hypothetical protein
MPTKTPVTVSVTLTIILLILVGFATMFMQIVMLNGVMNEGQATTALGVTLGCQGVVIILGTIFARWLTKILIVRFQWNNALTVIVSVVVASFLGTVISFLSIITGQIAAGIK